MSWRRSPSPSPHHSSSEPPGPGAGAAKGFKDFTKGEREDREKYRAGMISRRELNKRKQQRRDKGYAYAGAGGVSGLMAPAMARRLKKFVVNMARESAEPIAKKMEDAGANITIRARRELSQALQQDSEKMVDMFTQRSRQMGREMTEGMHEVSVTEGRAPLVRMKHELGVGGGR